MTEKSTAHSSKLLLSLVIFLVAAVAVQSMLLLRIYQKGTRTSPTNDETPALTLVPKASAAPALPGPATPQGSATAPSPFGGFGFDPDDAWWNGRGDDWDPFAEMQRMRERVSRLFDDSFSRFQRSPGFSNNWPNWSFSPSTDLEEKGDRYIVHMNIPGADKSDISVDIEDRQLRVSGRIDEAVEEQDGNHVLRKERRSGRFERSITLPGPVDASGMTAEFDAGVLTVTIPKSEGAARSRTVQVL